MCRSASLMIQVLFNYLFVLLGVTTDKPTMEWNPRPETIPDEYVFEEIYEKDAERMKQEGFNQDANKYANMTSTEFTKKSPQKTSRVLFGTEFERFCTENCTP